MNDRARQHILAALKRALVEPGEHPLIRSGKLAGLFSSRIGAPAEAAQQAVKENLLQVVRTETHGKRPLDWVHLTPKGVEFLHQHESPVAVLRDLHRELKATQEALPAWLERMQQEWLAVMKRATERLDALACQVDQALRRLDAVPDVPASVAASTPWAVDAVNYLDHRKAGGADKPCPLPELFAAVRRRNPNLTLSVFHDGLRRLGDHKTIRLARFDGPPESLPAPEYALLDGSQVLFYAER